MLQDAFRNVLNYKPSEQDYRIWLVLNPAVWLIPILFAVLVIALAVHLYAFSLPGKAWDSGKVVPVEEVVVVEEVIVIEEVAPVEEAAPVAEEAAPVAEEAASEEAAPVEAEAAEEVVPADAEPAAETVEEPIPVEVIVAPEAA
ncbi:hypothetical protein CKO25_08900 [Thiocapsa imhoffii]|uniref:Antenna complex alpha/beta subunit domain-containing protein n=1 Tax=Thiocapsa imhoffii TaxID=382777 RepID=A0A9X1B8C8_9GAMM|nr:hypothetical protein [Thiocapsa imhoffii]